MKHGEVLARLARESGRRLGELGVRPEDQRWIRTQAETIASLTEGELPGRSGGGILRRWARRLARAAR